MVVLIDTNVVINYITGRDDDEKEASRKIMELCASDYLQGFLAFHSLSIIWYVFRKKPKEETRKWLKNICEILTVTGASHSEVLDAINNEKFTDFEDCLQVKCAKQASADYIITVNTRDYTLSPIPAIMPSDLLKILPR